jgi:hypothetical protein
LGDRPLVLIEGLATVLTPGGRRFRDCFSDEEPGEQGPTRVSKKELHDAFAEGWVMESIGPFGLGMEVTRPSTRERRGRPRLSLWV